MINNYSHIGFLPGNSLQSSEINEIQERFYLDQTLQNNFLYNWLIFSDNYQTITGLSGDAYLGSNKCLPINPNLIESYYDNGNVIINLKVGWYKINSEITSNMSIWCYLDEVKTLSVPFTANAGLYTVVLDISLEEILCSSIEEDEGYAFNSNVGGFIEPWIQGSNRFKLKINDLILRYPSEQNLYDAVIAKIRTGIDGIEIGRFLVQYNNNYKINDINIT